MRERLEELWNGRVALAPAFWSYAIGYGTLFNLVATGAAFTIIVLGWPAIFAVVLHFLPIPYNLVMVVAVWRSAARYEGEAKGETMWANLARGTIVIWAAVMTLV